MPRRFFDIALAASAVVGVIAATYFAFRYGDTYTIGDTQHLRDDGADMLRVALPLLWVIVSTVVFAVRRLHPDGVRAEWRREREELRQAKATDAAP